VHGVAVLTRILRRRITRPAVRAVPTIVRRTAAVLRRQAQAGQPATRRTAAQVMANQTRQVLSSPRAVNQAVRRNVRATAAVARPARRTGAPAQRRRPRPRYATGGRNVVVARMPSGRLIPARVIPVRAAQVVAPRRPNPAGARRIPR
jgi:hypothetical protein